MWLLLSNLVLRFSWAHRLLGDMEMHNEVLMAVALLEVVRRWQWSYARVETELSRRDGSNSGALGSATSPGGGDHVPVRTRFSIPLLLEH